jgi:hypothetical protein
MSSPSAASDPYFKEAAAARKVYAFLSGGQHIVFEVGENDRTTHPPGPEATSMATPADPEGTAANPDGTAADPHGTAADPEETAGEVDLAPIEVVPFWSSRNRIKAAQKENPDFGSYEVKEFSLDQFTGKVIPSLLEAGVWIGANWEGRPPSGFIYPCDEFRALLEAAKPA